ncbi:hypothetical protein [Xylanimonas sp. McL0601]|uniref:hypothetical protein n=1 Tax=Xylanimonas sp. McL0601 TaxID=3414739 RepID=UPI003CF7812D
MADEAAAVSRRVGALALDHFPDTILPDPLIQELSHLLGAGRSDVALVEELAADIFMGRFSDKFRRAAQVAARKLAEAALAGVASRLELAPRQERPLATVKDAAYAWRQMVFFLSVAPSIELCPFIDRAEARHGRVGGMRQLLGGLREAADSSTPPRQFVGWVTGRHRILDVLGVSRWSA